MDKIAIARGTYLPDGTVQHLPEGTAAIRNMEGGLCLQFYEDCVLAQDVAYGVTHHAGYRLTGPWFRYAEARLLQQALLALPIDWTADQDTLNILSPAIAHAKALIQVWKQTHAVFEEERS